MSRDKKEPKRRKEHALRLRDSAEKSDGENGSPGNRQYGSTHSSDTKDRLSRQPHRRARQEGRREIASSQSANDDASPSESTEPSERAD